MTRRANTNLHTKKEQEFHNAFRAACYALRGYDYPDCLGSEIDVANFFNGPGADVDRMVHRFGIQYNRMADRWPPEVVAGCLTNQWWDHLFSIESGG